MNEVFTSMLMGEIHAEDILIRKISDSEIIFISQQELKEIESITIKVYRLEESTYEQFPMELFNIEKLSVENTHSVYKAQYTNQSKEYIRALHNVLLFVEKHSQIRKGDYSGVDFLNDTKPIYPASQDMDIHSDLKLLQKEWFQYTVDNQENEKFECIAKDIEIAFALNTYDLMQKCRNKPFDVVYQETLQKYHLEHHGLLKKGVKRIYIGNEFCPSLFPFDNIIEYIQKAYNEDYEVTVMMSFMNESIKEKTLNSIAAIDEYCIQINKRVEVVVNDWGVLNYISKETKMIDPVLGRLLNKRKKDPRKKWIWRNQQDDTIQYNCLADNDYYRKFVNDHNIERYEFEVFEDMNQKQEVALKGNKNSLHFPFYQMMTSLTCPLFYEYNHFRHGKLRENCCPHPCTEIVRLYSKHLHMIGIGNSNFVYNNEILNDPDLLRKYCDNQIDRLVFSPVV